MSEERNSNIEKEISELIRKEDEIVDSLIASIHSFVETTITECDRDIGKLFALLKVIEVDYNEDEVKYFNTEYLEK